MQRLIPIPQNKGTFELRETCSNVPLFCGIGMNHIQRAHTLWSEHLLPTDWVIDATCGNGKDTSKLAELVPQGGVIALDIQEIALNRAKERLKGVSQVHFYLQSHENFPEIARQNPIRLIVYNLGYLPGGDKSITTKTSSTLQSLKNALLLLAPKGMICITLYPGHPEGVKEQEVILTWTQEVKEEKIYFRNPLNPTAPGLLLIIKN
jgi:SAM-dependent methyltransferase